MLYPDTNTYNVMREETPMKVNLVSHSQGPYWKDADHPIAEPKQLDELVAYCARVSNPANQMNTDTNERLLAYLIDHKHFSPFEMVSVCLEIETTRDIARQILRHRSFSFQEFSQRYANIDQMGDEMFVLRDARLQDEKNRQNSVELEEGSELDTIWKAMQQGVIDESLKAYNWAIENGIAKEQARCVLPEGNTVSRLYMNGTLRSWIHYIELRGANGTQQEHILVARECAKVIAQIYPHY